MVKKHFSIILPTIVAEEIQLVEWEIPGNGICLHILFIFNIYSQL